LAGYIEGQFVVNFLLVLRIGKEREEFIDKPGYFYAPDSVVVRTETGSAGIRLRLQNHSEE